MVAQEQAGGISWQHVLTGRRRSSRRRTWACSSFTPVPFVPAATTCTAHSHDVHYTLHCENYHETHVHLVRVFGYQLASSSKKSNTSTTYIT